MRTSSHRTVLTFVAALALAAPSAHAADKRVPKFDIIWVHPAYDSMNIKSIALLPPATYDHSIPTEKTVESGWVTAFKDAGYRLYGSTLSKELLRTAFKGDSVIKALNDQLLKTPRVDSLTAPALCRALRVNALMSVRVDQWETVEMEWNQSGKPWTSIQLRAALVDSSGRLLWSASGTENGEGPYHDASAGTLGVKSSGLGTTPITGQGNAPTFPEVLSRLLTRWVQRFPPRVTATPAPTTPPGGN